VGSILAFPPSFGGAQHAETLLVTGKESQVLTPALDWPTEEFEIRGKTYRVPTLEVID